MQTPDIKPAYHPTPQRVTVQVTEGDGFTYRGSCNLCHWESRRVRPALGDAQTDCRKHARTCSATKALVKELAA